jgi:CTP:molybdopterin cytidylyltransferase MocA
MVRRAAKAALACCSPVVVVTGAQHAELSAALSGLGEGLVVVQNPDWASGRVGSAIAGILALPDASKGFLLHHADMPYVGADVFEKLLRAVDDARSPPAGQARHALCLVAAHGGQPGHPVFFPPAIIPAIMALGGGERLKGLLETWGSSFVECGSGAVLDDIDTLEDYLRLERMYRQGQGSGRAQ